ncbi:hypothetical protein SAMN05421858_4515 [Haladaptatus litoreus]|uniref:Uncharacterized protein n=1 Tax=Haladaptatus litoreus TaxID=553468 RepID=A0A1N7EUT6_9EURY|nr:hypothetical protein SAMN05421858_4515 [Haladaptatus litoreus]
MNSQMAGVGALILLIAVVTFFMPGMTILDFEMKTT